MFSKVAFKFFSSCFGGVSTCSVILAQSVVLIILPPLISTDTVLSLKIQTLCYFFPLGTLDPVTFCFEEGRVRCLQFSPKEMLVKGDG